MLPKDRELQIIRKHVGHPECVFSTFDFANTMACNTCRGELISTEDFGTKLMINFDSINGTTLSRYFKYIQKKGADDPDSEMLHTLLDWVINNPYSQVQYGYESNQIEAIDMIHLHGGNVSLNYFRYVHDSIVKHYSGQDRIPLYERLMVCDNFYVSNPCDEMNLIRIKKMMNNHSRFKISLMKLKEKGIYDAVLDKYPEYFI